MARVLVPLTDLTPPKASLTTALTGTNNDLTFTAKKGGPGGNSIRIEYVVAGNNTPLTVVVSGYDITVNVATSGAGAATSTAAQIMTALQSNSDVQRLIDVANAASNDGTGVVTALSLTALSGGRLSTAQPALTNGDATNGHYITGADEYTVVEVVSSDASDRTVTVEFSPHYGALVDVPGSAETIPAGATRTLGPFEAAAFHQNASRDVYFTPSVANTLDFRAYRTVRPT